MAWWLLPSVGRPEEFNGAFQRLWLWAAENEAESQNGWGWPLILTHKVPTHSSSTPRQSSIHSPWQNHPLWALGSFHVLLHGVWRLRQEAYFCGSQVQGTWSCSTWRKGGSRWTLLLSTYLFFFSYLTTWTVVEVK